MQRRKSDVTGQVGKWRFEKNFRQFEEDNFVAEMERRKSDATDQGSVWDFENSLR